MESIITVIEDAPTRDLTTLATVKEELGITDNVSDNKLRRWIRETSGLIEKSCERIFAQQTLQEEFRQSGAYNPAMWWLIRPRHRFSNRREGALVLSRWPVTSIASVIEDDALEPDGVTPMPTDPSCYELNPRDGLLYRLLYGNLSDWFARKIVVTYTAGYPLLGDLPYPIEQACLLLLKHRWASQGRDPMLRQESIQGIIERQWWVGSTPNAGALPPEVEGMLQGFREIRI